MADNDTQVRASAESDDAVRQLIMYRYGILSYTSLALTTVTLIYGVTSWHVLKKFRNYKNFVFLNAILVNLLVVLTNMFFSYVLRNRLINSQTLAFQQFTLLNFFLYLYISTVRIYWLIVICHIFYVDIVKVFNGHTQRRHFKSSVFAWGLPFVHSVIYTYVISAVIVLKSDASYYVLFFSYAVPMILNTLLYIVIVCTLFRSTCACSHKKTSKWRRLYIATLIFLLSDSLICSSYVIKCFIPSATTAFIESLISLIINPLLLYVYFVVAKRNRVVWYEFYVNKLNERQRNRNIKMDLKTVCPTTDSRPPVINII